MAYGSPVVLETDFGGIRFDPVERPAGDLIAPFKLTCAAGVVEGGIALLGEHDPLRVELYHDDVHDDMFVWTTAVSGYADLTTWDVVSAAREGRRSGGRSASALGRSSAVGAALSRGSVTQRAKRWLPRGAPSQPSHWLSHLEPLGDTALRLESVVAGHKRVLPPGWTPSGKRSKERISAVSSLAQARHGFVRTSVGSGATSLGSLGTFDQTAAVNVRLVDR